jgi:hypothetical protein
MDLGDSYDDEESDEKHAKAHNGKQFPEYEDSDLEEEQLIEGQLNSG